MDIEHVKRINFEYRELMVARLGKTNKKRCYVELVWYLHKNRVPYTIQEVGVFFTLNELDQSVE